MAVGGGGPVLQRLGATIGRLRLTEDGCVVQRRAPARSQGDGRVLIDSAKRRASKFKPKVYGDRLELAGKTTTTDVVDQPSDWLKAKVAELKVKVAGHGAAQDENEQTPALTVH